MLAACPPGQCGARLRGCRQRAEPRCPWDMAVPRARPWAGDQGLPWAAARPPEPCCSVRLMRGWLKPWRAGTQELGPPGHAQRGPEQVPRGQKPWWHRHAGREERSGAERSISVILCDPVISWSFTPQGWLPVSPAGSPAPAPALAPLSLPDQSQPFGRSPPALNSLLLGVFSRAASHSTGSSKQLYLRG